MTDLINLNKDNYREYLKTIISIEMDIKNEEILEKLVEKYLEDTKEKMIISNKFEDYLEEILKEK